MAIHSATLTFSLPQDPESDYLYIFSADAQNGVFSEVRLTPYTYGEITYEYDELDDTRWYRIQFYNSKNDNFGPLSLPVFGGSYAAGAPVVYISTTTDGANYATVQDVYDYADLNGEDVSPQKVSTALRRARAEIDYKTAEMGIDRFDFLDSDTQRRKYNAGLHIIKEAEICLALYQIYTNLSDNLILKNMRDASTGSVAGNISIGDTSISGDALAERSENILYLATLADRYLLMAQRKLNTLAANSIRLLSTDYKPRFPRFKWPFHGWK